MKMSFSPWAIFLESHPHHDNSLRCELRLTHTPLATFIYNSNSFHTVTAFSSAIVITLELNACFRTPQTLCIWRMMHGTAYIVTRARFDEEYHNVHCVLNAVVSLKVLIAWYTGIPYLPANLSPLWQVAYQVLSVTPAGWVPMAVPAQLVHPVPVYPVGRVETNAWRTMLWKWGAAIDAIGCVFVSLETFREYLQPLQQPTFQSHPSCYASLAKVLDLSSIIVRRLLFQRDPRTVVASRAI
jgi:hypothetical protein